MPKRPQPYRPMPADFEERFVELGWFLIEEHYHAHARTISRWIDQCGRRRLVRKRRKHVERQRKERQRVKRLIASRANGA